MDPRLSSSQSAKMRKKLRGGSPSSSKGAKPKKDNRGDMYWLASEGRQPSTAASSKAAPKKGNPAASKSEMRTTPRKDVTRSTSPAAKKPVKQIPRRDNSASNGRPSSNGPSLSNFKNAPGISATLPRRDNSASNGKPGTSVTLPRRDPSASAGKLSSGLKMPTKRQLEVGPMGSSSKDNLGRLGPQQIKRKDMNGR